MEKNNLIKVFFLVLMFFSLFPAARADDVVNNDNYAFKMGLGLIDSKPSAKVKNFGLRQESNFFAMLYDATEVGLWTDVGGQGRKSSLFVQYQWGIRPQSEHFYTKAFIGPALISTTDSQLGGNFQFAEDVGFGFQDKNSYVGFNYGHKSSAGIFAPNKGRDAITVELGIRY